jgi:hypothetical protein
MSEIKSVTVSGETYNIVQASAVQQKTLMTLVGARISLNSAASGADEISVPMLVGLLLSLSESDLDKISNIVLYKTVKHGGDNVVTIDDFQGKMNAYFALLAEAIKINLQDFFSWLDTENAKGREQMKTQ